MTIESYVLRLGEVRFAAKIGAFRGERAKAQELVVSVDLTLPHAALARRDRLKEVVDYGPIIDAVVEVGMATEYRLLECYAQDLAKRLFADTRAQTIRISVTKAVVPSPHRVATAAVELVAHRS